MVLMADMIEEEIKVVKKKKKKKQPVNQLGALDDSNYYSIIKNWQKGIMRVNLYLIIMMLGVEIAFMIALDATGEISVPIPQYIPRYILRPSLINFVVFALSSLAFRTDKVRNGLKSMVPLVCLTVILANMIIVHYTFPAIYMTIIVPLFISTIYGDVRISRALFFVLMGTYAVTMICIVTTPYAVLPHAFVYNAIIGFIALPLSYLVVRSIVSYEKQKEKLVVDQTLVNRRLQKEMLYDGLTGVLNHTGMFQYLEEKIKDHVAGDQLRMAILDIDYFKNVNDDFGHEAGNRVLVKLGELLNKQSGEDVHVARYGGEEFAMIFTNLSVSESMKVLKRLHKEFSEQTYEGIDRKITFSAGLADYKEGDSSTAFFERADKTLYKAKNDGRNRIIIAA